MKFSGLKRERGKDMPEISLDKIRNIGIMAHIELVRQQQLSVSSSIPDACIGWAKFTLAQLLWTG